VNRLTLIRAARRATARWRALPDVVIVGAQKGGTSSVFAHLAAQPGFVPSRPKETHFFDSAAYTDGIDRYRRHFPLTVTLRRQRAITGEATPNYLPVPEACTRLVRDVPDARLVVLLRDPAERALSHWKMNRRRGVDPLGFAEALATEADRTADLQGASFSGRLGADQLTYAARGRYAEQIAHLLSLGPRHPVLVLFSEHLFAESGPSLALLHDVLGLPAPTPSTQLPERNIGTDTPDDPGIGAALEDLRRSFAEPNRTLGHLLRAECDHGGSGRIVTLDPATWPAWVSGGDAGGGG
jgi:hypothetical protein